MSGLGEAETRELFLAACRAELAALKPGNVHLHAGGHGMEAAQFEASAVAAAPFIAAADLKVGERVLRGVEASLAAAGCNTNLGILLLAAPLAVAAQGKGNLRDSLRSVLAALDREDADAVYAAIRRADPGGLGSAPDQDVAGRPTVGLLEAMALAADRDRIARAYVTNFEEIFAFGLPALAAARAHAGDPHLAVTTLHMGYLAAFPDSHIARKFGIAIAEEVRARARELKPLWDPVAVPQSFAALLAFDAELKRRQINPGTTADFVVATLYAGSLCDRMGRRQRPEPLVE